ncbi:hypothetical protein [Actinopolymorpha rutila]|uniref:Uncharacterized protein n=1 Tax=Actinopolymorpha rutila TaxID=446787 RepID=A0A852ZGU1_9ACTN|nr:hypothetical protein [Actinopolymorpha rutila]NYH88240.1 hypothetical protein [Actinopolymorpha rutila]
MLQSTDDDGGHGRAGALEALLDVARVPEVIRDYPIASDVFEQNDYEQIVAIAWRHQFNDDRSRFKREIRELQEHVSQRILDNLETIE